MAKTPRCKGCSSYFGISYTKQKVQRARLIRTGYGNIQIKDAMPRCRNCITIWKKLYPLKREIGKLKGRDCVNYY